MADNNMAHRLALWLADVSAEAALAQESAESGDTLDRSTDTDARTGSSR
jgi:hypothetical protein